MLLEYLDVYRHGPIRPQHQFTRMLQDAVVPAQGLARMVQGLAQVGRAGVRIELRPQGVNDEIARQAVAWLQAEQLQQVGCAQAGPALGGDLDAVNGDREAAEQSDFQPRWLTRYVASRQRGHDGIHGL